MGTKNLECQIATGQIGRYLAGEQLSAEAIRQLEGHVADCLDCKQTLTERRNQLMAMLGQTPTRAVAQVPSEPKPERTPRPARAKAEAQPEPIPAAHPFMEALRAAQAKVPVASPKNAAVQTQPAQPSQPARPPVGLSKPLLLSGALALVLVAMSYASRNGMLTGTKAMAASMLADAVTEKSAKSEEPKKVAPKRPATQPENSVPEKPLVTPASVPAKAVEPVRSAQTTPTTTVPEAKPNPVKTSTSPAAPKKPEIPKTTQANPAPTPAVAPAVNPAPAKRTYARRRWRSKRTATKASVVRAYDPSGAPIQ